MESTKICLFTGAGVNAPLGLPITNGFTSTLSKIEPGLKQYIDSFLGNSANDIEKVLYVLEDFVKAESLASHILRKHSSDSRYNQFSSLIDSLKYQAHIAIRAIKVDIYQLLKPKDLQQSYRMYADLLKEISETFLNPAFSIFTTNYDTAFESAMYDNSDELESELGIKNIYFGFGEPKHGKNIFNAKEDFRWNRSIIEYQKLHGSLDWTRDRAENCIRSATDLNPADPAVMPLLYPGFKGTPTQEPFISIHERLYQRLNEVEVVFALGFAFRDPYINNLFEFALRTNKELKVLCYNPAEIDILPADSSIKYFSTRYKENFFHIKEGVETTATPLKLKTTLTKLAIHELVK